MNFNQAAHDAWNAVDGRAGTRDNGSGHDIRVIKTVEEALKEAVNEKKQRIRFSAQVLSI